MRKWHWHRCAAGRTGKLVARERVPSVSARHWCTEAWGSDGRSLVAHVVDGCGRARGPPTGRRVACNRTARRPLLETTLMQQTQYAGDVCPTLSRRSYLTCLTPAYVRATSVVQRTWHLIHYHADVVGGANRLASGPHRAHWQPKPKLSLSCSRRSAWESVLALPRGPCCCCCCASWARSK